MPIGRRGARLVRAEDHARLAVGLAAGPPASSRRRRRRSRTLISWATLDAGLIQGRGEGLGPSSTRGSLAVSITRTAPPSSVELGVPGVVDRGRDELASRVRERLGHDLEDRSARMRASGALRLIGLRRGERTRRPRPPGFPGPAPRRRPGQLRIGGIGRLDDQRQGIAGDRLADRARPAAPGSCFSPATRSGTGPCRSRPASGRCPSAISDSVAPRGADDQLDGPGPDAGVPGRAARPPAAAAAELGDPATAGPVNSAGRDGTNDPSRSPADAGQSASVSPEAPSTEQRPPARFAAAADTEPAHHRDLPSSSLLE